MKSEIQTLNLDMRFHPEKMEAAMQLLTFGIEQIQSKPGCEACSVSRDDLDAALVHYSERWSPNAVFRKHLGSPEFRRVLIALDLCSEEPQVIVGSLTGCFGLAGLQELVEQCVGSDGDDSTKE